MYTETAHLYDPIYKSFKDFRQEALDLAREIQLRFPRANAILDVACGSGEHAKALSEELGYQIDGIDLQESFLDIARKKCPLGTFVQADMRDFELKRKYDVILCLFSAIGYVRDLPGLQATVRCMSNHLVPRGLLFIDPWFPPGVLQEGKISTTTIEADGVTIVRMAHTHLHGNLSVLTFAYMVGDGKGIVQKVEKHELGLFTKEEMTQTLHRNGFSVEFDPKGPSGRGLYIGLKGGIPGARP